ncbi:MAG TPA: aldolase/citrate lyase family protein [Thermomicrobiales bacterium]|nr:aldolase/citrate lyase family protein [Thermomicrobiales bacterium]
MKLVNPVRETLRDGGVCIGTFLNFPSPELVEICALAGFDFVLIDAEHGPITPESCYTMILAAEARGIPTLARIGEHDRQVILKYLDIGIGGVVVPQVNDAATARQMVQALRYAPLGFRGVAGGRTYDYGQGAPAVTLIPKLNERILSSVQFEHIDALDNIDEILATPDLDVLFVGPNDLAQSMGYPGQPLHPEVQAIIDRVVAAARGGPVALGTVAFDPESTKRQIERGFRLIAGNLPSLIAGAARKYLDAARA